MALTHAWFGALVIAGLFMGPVVDEASAEIGRRRFSVQFVKQLTNPGGDPGVWEGRGRIGTRIVKVQALLSTAGIVPITPRVLGIQDFLFRVINPHSGAILYEAKLAGRANLASGQIALGGNVPLAAGSNVQLRANSPDGLFTVHGAIHFTIP